MRPYVVGEDVSHISISEPDKQNGSSKEGDMIARNPKNHADQWLVAKKYFEDNLEPETKLASCPKCFNETLSVHISGGGISQTEYGTAYWFEGDGKCSTCGFEGWFSDSSL